MHAVLAGVVLAGLLAATATAQGVVPTIPVQGNPSGPPVNTAPVHAEATSCSGSVAAGGTAQQLVAAGVITNGMAVQNQSNGALYIRSRTSTGAVNATLDSNSLLIAAGGYFEVPHISGYAYSIIGATTGQNFYCRTW